MSLIQSLMSFTDPANLGYSKNFTRNFECFSLPFNVVVDIFLATICFTLLLQYYTLPFLIQALLFIL